MTTLAAFTTLGLGGPCDRLVMGDTEAALVAEVLAADAAGTPLLLLAGGSNVVIADDGFAGTVLLIRTSGISRVGDTLTVAAGTSWDEVVATSVGMGLAGMEALSGIPGSTGATPVQNVGAYGQDVSQTIGSVRVLDRQNRAVRETSCKECAFGYRTSVFKRSEDRYVVLSVEFHLTPSPLSGPVDYAELARVLDVPPGGRAPLEQVRTAVLGLRAGKGMVLNPSDPDTRSVGSFFTNPIVSARVAAQVAERAGARPPQWPVEDAQVKLSAAWLVQRSGFDRGHGTVHARVSTKHTLALTHPGGGTTGELLALARDIRNGVRERLGVELVPEPVLVGCAL